LCFVLLLLLACLGCRGKMCRTITGIGGRPAGDHLPAGVCVFSSSSSLLSLLTLGFMGVGEDATLIRSNPYFWALAKF
jgi:hypothetical protein